MIALVALESDISDISLDSGSSSGSESNPTVEGGGDVTNLSPVEDGNGRNATPSGDRFDVITG